MTSKASSDFWSCFAALPPSVQGQARKQYALFRADPQHSSLQFKDIAEGLVSVRVSRRYRALGWRQGDLILWFWIGSHADYDKIISRY
jgi:hypothetical protein